MQLQTIVQDWNSVDSIEPPSKDAVLETNLYIDAAILEALNVSEVDACFINGVADQI